MALRLIEFEVVVPGPNLIFVQFIFIILFIERW